MKAIILKTTDPTPRLAEISTDLEALQGAVGGWIEDVPHNTPGVSVYCDEEGKIKGLPINPHAAALDAAIDLDLRADDVLVGDLVVCGIDGEGGETVSAPQGVIDRLLG